MPAAWIKKRRTESQPTSLDPLPSYLSCAAIGSRAAWVTFHRQGFCRGVAQCQSVIATRAVALRSSGSIRSIPDARQTLIYRARAACPVLVIHSGYTPLPPSESPPHLVFIPHQHQRNLAITASFFFCTPTTTSDDRNPLLHVLLTFFRTAGRYPLVFLLCLGFWFVHQLKEASRAETAVHSLFHLRRRRQLAVHRPRFVCAPAFYLTSL